MTWTIQNDELLIINSKFKYLSNIIAENNLFVNSGYISLLEHRIKVKSKNDNY